MMPIVYILVLVLLSKTNSQCLPTLYTNNLTTGITNTTQMSFNSPLLNLLTFTIIRLRSNSQMFHRLLLLSLSYQWEEATLLTV